MKLWIFVVALLGLCRVARATPLPTLDMDALLFASESVVEGPIRAVQVRNYGRSAQVRVERTWAGRNFTGRSIGVGALDLYVKEDPQGRSGYLSSGDRAIFFLQEPPLDLVHLPGVSYWALPSGVRLIRGGQIAGFTQRSNPGGYNPMRGVSCAVFEAGFAASVARVADLKKHLRAPVRLGDRQYFANWKLARLQRRKPRRFEWSGGAIDQAIETRLPQIARLKIRA